jgi:hypothetical protein
MRAVPARFALSQHLLLARIHLARGHLDLAREQGRTAIRLVERIIDPPSQASVQGYLAELAAWQGDYDTARAAAALALQHIADSEEHNVVIFLCHVGLRAEANTAERARDRRAARSEVEDSTRQASDCVPALARRSAGSTPEPVFPKPGPMQPAAKPSSPG